jgi:ATP-dependent Clp protease ATP-binding subunit ClpA
VLAKYSRDLTSLAAEGKLDPVIGRHDEMRRLIDVLCRRTKNRCGSMKCSPSGVDSLTAVGHKMHA